VDSARRTADDLLLARIEDRHMQFLARRGTHLGELHEASYLRKTDFMHGAALGAGIGGLGGLLFGAVLVAYPIEGTQPKLGVVLVAGLVGVALGAWMASMAAAAVPNSRLKAFHAAIEKGQVLLMVDVPRDRVDEVRALVAGTHPEAVNRGMEARFPAFP